MIDKNILSNFVLHYNSFTDTWCAAKREHFNELFSGEKGNVLKSKDVNVLIEVIMRTGGDEKEINALVGDTDFQEQYPI